MQLQKMVEDSLLLYARNPTDESYQILIAAKFKLQLLQSEQFEYSLKCFNQHYWKSGEKGGEFVIYHLKPQQHNSISGIQNNNGQLFTEIEYINDWFYDFDNQLHKFQNSVTEQQNINFQEIIEMEKISQEDKNKLAQPLTFQETTETIQSMNTGKTEFPVEWYRIFRNLAFIFLNLHQMFSFAYISFIFMRLTAIFKSKKTLLDM